MSMGSLLLLFIIVPAAELAVLIRLNDVVGLTHTILLIIVTGVVGASLARHQGLLVLREINRDLAAGRMPAPRLIDGVMVLIAGALLVTPGLLTDLVGLLLLLPFVRTWLRGRLRTWFESRIQSGQTTVRFGRFPPNGA